MEKNFSQNILNIHPHWISIISAFLFFGSIFLLIGINLIFGRQPSKKVSLSGVLGESVTNYENENDYLFWQKLISIYPDYNYGYLQLTKLELERGNRKKAEKYFQIFKSFVPF